MIKQLICELVNYGTENNLIEYADTVYVKNSLLELFNILDFQEPASVRPTRELHLILEDMLTYAVENGILKDDTITSKDLFDTKIMGKLTPLPSVVRNTFAKEYENSPQKATDYYYQFSQATNFR